MTITEQVDEYDLSEEEIPEGPEPFYPDVEAWVTQFFIPAFSRSALGTRWCSRWYLHTEAVIAFRAMWMSWEGARAENGPSSIATWLVHIAYPLLHEVCGPAGAFAACMPDRHAAPEIWPVHPIPEGFWPDEGF